MIKLLIVLANYGTKNDHFLRRVIDEYRTLPYEVHIVVLTSEPKTVEGANEVIVHRPTGNPWNFPFPHKAILAERVEQFDLFIYSEDDTLITRDNIEAFLAADEVLAEDEIAGFLRTEQIPGGQTSISTINGHFHWDPASVVRRGQDVFAYFSNEHAACYLLTRKHLQRAIQSGGFLVAPHEEKYDLLVTAATDPYTQCGFRKLVCISQFERFLIAHLPNKYVGRFGVGLDEVRTQLGAMKEISSGLRPPVVLLNTETRLRHQRWSKVFFDALRPEILSAVPGSARTLLSFGSGCGSVEAALAARGVEVTAVPLDSVVGACVEAQNIPVIYGDDSDSIWQQMGPKRFDCILVVDLLHLVPEPALLLAKMAKFLETGGTIVATVPNIMQLRTLWMRMKGDPAFELLGDYGRANVHPASYWSIRRWFKNAGLTVQSVDATKPQSNRRWYHAAARVFPPGFAGDFIVQASTRAE